MGVLLGVTSTAHNFMQESQRRKSPMPEVHISQISELGQGPSENIKTPPQNSTPVCSRFSDEYVVQDNLDHNAICRPVLASTLPR